MRRRGLQAADGDAGVVVGAIALDGDLASLDRPLGEIPAEQPALVRVSDLTKARHLDAGCEHHLAERLPPERRLALELPLYAVAGIVAAMPRLYPASLELALAAIRLAAAAVAHAGGEGASGARERCL
jgi:hypothetical protein